MRTRDARWSGFDWPLICDRENDCIDKLGVTMTKQELLRLAVVSELCLLIVSFAEPLNADVLLPNLPYGSQYQIAFVTADARNASSTNISDYNSFVTQEAAANPSLPTTTWRAIASTPSVNAINNAATSASIPIYNTHGQKIANGSSDFWYPAHLAGINYDQYGIQEFSLAWTGSNPNGSASNPLGQLNAENGYVPNYTSSQWISYGESAANNASPFYALSAPVTLVSTVVGDFNQDGQVTVADIQPMLVALADLKSYETTHLLTDQQLLTIGDINKSGSITNADVQALIVLIANKANGTGSIEIVPEPPSLTLSVMAAVTLLVCLEKCRGR